MSIPLDRLYHYIDSLVREIHEDNIIIYRFFPHGSKKLDDLKLLSFYDNHQPSSTWIKRMYSPTLICHDQEPLFFDYYSTKDFAEQIPKNNLFGIANSEYVDHIIDMHLRGITVNRYNVWDHTLLCHSEKNSKELQIYENAGYIGVYYWSHAIIARDWFRFAEFDKELDTDLTNIKHDFLIYNRAWAGTREYRLKFAELLLDHNLTPHCHIKFSPTDLDVHYTNHTFKNSSFNLHRTDLEDHYAVNDTPSTYSADYDSNDYKECSIEVVLETLFDDSRLHLTEKALRPIACGRPFILAGTAGSLEYLKSYGFKTFDGLIDESYDTITDPAERLKQIVIEMQRIAQLGDHEKQLLWKQLYAIAEYNKQLFFSHKWHADILNELKLNLHQGLSLLKQHHTGKHFRTAREIYKKDPILTEQFLTTDRPERTLEELDQILQFMDQK